MPHFSPQQAKWMEVQQTFKQLREALKMSTAEAVQALVCVLQSPCVSVVLYLRIFFVVSFLVA